MTFDACNVFDFKGLILRRGYTRRSSSNHHYIEQFSKQHSQKQWSKTITQYVQITFVNLSIYSQTHVYTVIIPFDVYTYDRYNVIIKMSEETL